jgi:hypothetical protein
MIYDWMMMALVHCLLLEGVAFGEFGHQVLSWWRLYCSYKDSITVARLLFVFLLLFVLRLCAFECLYDIALL